MKTFIVIILFAGNAFFQLVFATKGLEQTTLTGPTPATIECPQSLCAGKSDGNHNIQSFPNYFLQCSNGKASCQPCWPLSLIFNQACNQCLYLGQTSCHTTQSWVPQSTYACPDACLNKGPNFSGNIADKISNKGAGNPYHYISCWKGATMGCITCPAGLKFNEAINACLYDGQYFTQPIGK